MTRKVPMRTCIGCGQVREKKELVRIVRAQDGTVRLDVTGRANGRGAYLCPDPSCAEKARKRKALSRAFGGAVPADSYEQLRTQLEEYDLSEDGESRSAAQAFHGPDKSTTNR